MNIQGYPLVIKVDYRTWLVIGWDSDRYPVCIPADPSESAEELTIVRGQFSICSYGMDRRA